MEKILLVGGGGHAEVLSEIIRNNKDYELAGYVDFKNYSKLEAPYLGDDNTLKDLFSLRKIRLATIGVGSVGPSLNRIRIFNKLKLIGYSLPPIIAAGSNVSQKVTIGEGSTVLNGVVINSGCNIGKCVIINSNSTIEHHCVIEDFVHIASGATLGGNVYIGKGTHVGIGATIIQGISIANNSLIGAGSVVVKPCEIQGKYWGIPARLIEKYPTDN